ncbi:hypothetical protein ONZ45_g8257 [Pleurotus djamor]|nr:hypothetical protein ONZ45_g8257 [Pleurotus djamor]
MLRHKPLRAGGGTPPANRCFKVELSSKDKTEEAVAAISRAVATSNATPSFASNLNPPIGVIGFKRGTLDNSANLFIPWLAWRSDNQFGAPAIGTFMVQRYEFTWFTDYYAYATRADPRGKTAADFDREGGIVYTVAINRGENLPEDNIPVNNLTVWSSSVGEFGLTATFAFTFRAFKSSA